MLLSMPSFCHDVLLLLCVIAVELVKLNINFQHDIWVSVGYYRVFDFKMRLI